MRHFCAGSDVCSVGTQALWDQQKANGDSMRTPVLAPVGLSGRKQNYKETLKYMSSERASNDTPPALGQVAFRMSPCLIQARGEISTQYRRQARTGHASSLPSETTTRGLFGPITKRVHCAEPRYKEVNVSCALARCQRL